jgi:2-dehydropantoate 2-reductase
LFLCVKGYDNDRALAACEPVLVPGATIVTVQNGLPEIGLVERFGSERVVRGVTEKAANLIAPGHVLETFAQGWVVGQAGAIAVSERVRRVSEIFGVAGPSEPCANLAPYTWSKFCINAMFNPLCAATGKTMGEVLLDPPLRSALVALGREIRTLAAAHGAAFEPSPLFRFEWLDASEEDLGAAVRDLAHALMATKPSMLQDREKGRQTEIEAINGRAVSLAAAAGLPLPANGAITAIVRGLDETGGFAATGTVAQRLAPASLTVR